MQAQIIRLDIPFRKKEQLKPLGIKWNAAGGFWFCYSDNPNLEKLGIYRVNSLSYYEDKKQLAIYEYEPFPDDRWKWVRTGNFLIPVPSRIDELISETNQLISMTDVSRGDRSKVISRNKVLKDRDGVRVYLDIGDAQNDALFISILHFGSEADARKFIRPISSFFERERELWLRFKGFSEASIGAYYVFEEDGKMIEDSMECISIWT